jgi:hypothetical protein
MEEPAGGRKASRSHAFESQELDARLGKYRRLWKSRLDRFGAALEKQRQGRARQRK